MMVMAHHQTVAFELAKRAREHSLRHAMHASADFRVAQLARYAQRMNNT